MISFVLALLQSELCNKLISEINFNYSPVRPFLHKMDKYQKKILYFNIILYYLHNIWKKYSHKNSHRSCHVQVDVCMYSQKIYHSSINFKDTAVKFIRHMLKRMRILIMRFMHKEPECPEALLHPTVQLSSRVAQLSRDASLGLTTAWEIY